MTTERLAADGGGSRSLTDRGTQGASALLPTDSAELSFARKQWKLRDGFVRGAGTEATQLAAILEAVKDCHYLTAEREPTVRNPE